jgi:hypothetical protein
MTGARVSWLRVPGIFTLLGGRAGQSIGCRSAIEEKQTIIARHQRARKDRGAMLTSCLHFRGKSRSTSLSPVALSPMHNKALETDAHGRPLPPVAPLLGRRSVLR